MTDEEAKEKRDKGLCFRCDERYFRGHKCKSKEKRELNLLIVHEEEGDGSEAELPMDESPEVKVMEVANNVEVVLRSILGFSAKGTMKLKGIVAGKEVLVMIDCGVTHNFIHQTILDELELPLSETSHYGVVVGNGVALKGKRICKAIMVVLPNLTIYRRFLIVRVGSGRRDFGHGVAV